MRSKNIFVVIFTALFLVLPISSSIVKAEDSIVGDFANKTFSVELTDGTGIFDNDPSARESINNKIIQGTEDRTLSLYDRFGGNIRFVPYFGEKKFGINMADKVYSNIKKNNGEFTINAKELLKESDAKVNNKVYEGRPDIISESEYEAGLVDPRRSAYNVVSDTGGEASVGNMYLEISIAINSLVSYFVGNHLYEDVTHMWDVATNSTVFTIASKLINSIMPLIVMFFVIYLLFSVSKLLKGERSIGEVLIVTISFMLSVGIVFSTLANPSVLKPVSDFIIKGTNDVFSSALKVDANEVTKSDDNKYIIEATLWSKSVLDPWAMGMFDGRKYDELYTQYAGNNKSKLPQSHQDILEKREDGSRRYGSSYLTGDVKIPLGHEQFTQNWAALAWSTQSLYHIDAVETKKEETTAQTEEGESTKKWPKATVTPKNNQLYVDSFRWLDAKLNISPGYDGPEDEDGNYADSRPYKTSFIKYGTYSLFLSLLMLPLLYPGVIKLIALIKTITAGLRWMYLSIMSIVKPGDSRYSQISNIKSVLLPGYHFFWWSLVIYLMVYLYSTLIGTIIGDVAWLILSIIIIKFKPVNPPKYVRQLQSKVKMQFNNITRKFTR